MYVVDTHVCDGISSCMWWLLTAFFYLMFRKIVFVFSKIMEELSSYAYPRKKKAKVSDERTDIGESPLHEDELEAKEFIDKFLRFQFIFV